jgi:hypothetical protein
MKFRKLLFAILPVGLILIFFTFYSGSWLYEVLLFPIVLFFYLIWKNLLQLGGIKEDRLLELLLALVIAFFAVMQTWVAMYEKLPRVYTPGIKCENYLYLTSDGHGNFSVSFGNYGNLPAWLYIRIENTTDSLSVTEPSGYEGFVLVPVIYQDNKQTTITFNFKVDSTKELVGFKVKYLVHGDDLIDKAAFAYKKLFSIFNQIQCNYLKINETTYSLK